VFDPDEVRPATREESTIVLMAAVLFAFVALIVCFTHGYVLLYGDAVAHLGIARRIFDSRNPGMGQLGGVWLPLPHLLMLPFVQKMDWWQSGLAGAWPSLGCYILGVVGFYRLCRRMLVPRWALAATAFYGLNPNLLYLSTTAMTEPLFLALLVWMTLLTAECVDAIHAAQQTRVARRLVGLGLLIFAAVFTRYDGWVLGAAVWCVLAWQLGRAGALWRRVAPAFAVFTLLAVAGPVLWLWYNQHFAHDPLDFMRGPYSAPAIEKRTSPPGSRHYRGWHNPGWALLFYMRTAQVDAAFWETGTEADRGFIDAAVGPTGFLCVFDRIRLGADLYSAALAALVLQRALRHGTAPGAGPVCVCSGG
jgi:4-amino-4-deoxy-L-arabinose transferase-like glycosyltransferase